MQNAILTYAFLAIKARKSLNIEVPAILQISEFMV